MNKKIIAIIVLIIAILILGFFFYTQNTVKVGNSYFAVPEGYHRRGLPVHRGGLFRPGSGRIKQR